MQYIETDLTAGQKIIALDALIEPLEYHLENTPNEFINWDDFTLELADSIVPVWNHDRVQWWLDMGTPEAEDYSRGVGESVIDEITYTIYIAVENFLGAVINNADIDSEIKFAEKLLGGVIVPSPEEVLTKALEYREQLGVSQGYANLAKAIIK